MRCGLVRLMTRRCPYDARVRRKAWNSNHRGESGALNDVAESRVMGRYCAHKLCRLMEKSSKIFSRVFSGSNITTKKTLPKAPFLNNWSDRYAEKDKPFASNCLRKVKSGSQLELPSFTHRTRSNVGLTQQNYSTIDRNSLHDMKIKASKPHHVLTKHKLPGYKRYSSQRLLTRRNFNSISATNKRYKPACMKKSKLLPPKKLYIVRSPFVTYPDYDDNKYVNRMKNSLRSQHSNPNSKPEFFDHNVLNHLNETSCVSFCGCETCGKKIKEYEQKNKKINYLLQNKLSKIINYCKKKNPFYKIYTQNPVDEECLQEYSKYGVNGWMNYFDAYNCCDKSPCAVKNENHCFSPNKTTECVNTNNKQEKPAGSLFNICLEPANENICNKNGICEQHFEEQTNKNAAAPENHQPSTLEEKQEGLKDNGASFKKKDDSTTQTQNCEAPVTNYYYVTNNTLNTNCCCRDEASDKPTKKPDNCLSNKDMKTNQNHLKNCGNIEEMFIADLTNNSNSKPPSSVKKTLKKVYEVMMQPVQQNCLSFQEHKTETKLNDINKEFGVTSSKVIENYNCGQGDSPITLKHPEILDFDAYMDLKYNELTKRSFGDNFRFLDDLRFSEMTKKPGLENINRYNCNTDNCPVSVSDWRKYEDFGNPDCYTNNKNINRPISPNNFKRKSKPKKKVNLEKKRTNSRLFKTLNDETNNKDRTTETYGKCKKPSHELGPLDHTNSFIKNNFKRYQEKVNILNRGPNFSQFPDSKWRDSMFDYDDKLSKTFDIMKGNNETSSINITADKTRDLTKYSKINMAIEKVKKRISNIINESDEDILITSSHMSKTKSRVRVKKSNPEVRPSNQLKLPRSQNSCKKYINRNYCSNINENNYSKDQKEINEKEDRNTNLYADADLQANHPPSSVHLNDIIEAIKENRNTDNFDHSLAKNSNKEESHLSDYNRNKSYRVYGSNITRNYMKKINLKNNAFFLKTGTEPISGVLNTTNLLSQDNITRNFSTSSKYKPFFLENFESRKKTEKENNLMGGSIFTGNIFAPEEMKKGNVKNMNKQTFCLKSAEKNRDECEVGKLSEKATLEANSPESQTFTQAEYIEYRTTCKEDLFKKSIDIFAENNKIEKNRKTEYSQPPSIPGIVERYNVKHNKDQQVFNQIEENINKMSATKFWKVWDPKNWEIEADISRKELSPKGLTKIINKNKNDLKSGDQAIFNGMPKVKSTYNDHFDEVKSYMNFNGRRDFRSVKASSNNCPNVNYSRCVNVGDLGLNFTSFALNKSEEREKGKSRKEDRRKSVYGSENRINNVCAENTSVSRKPELHLRETRTVGLRPCNKNDILPNSLRIRNSFLIDGHNTLRLATSTNTVNKRQASSNIPDNDDIKKRMASKIKNIQRIDHLDYTREEKSMSEKEAVESIKIKESFTTRNSKYGYPFDTPEAVGNDDTIKYDMCAKEVEMRKKHKSIQDGLTKQITEEMNVSGVFPEGKKAIHSKLVSVYSNKPKNKFTILKNRVKGLESIRDPSVKDPITVQMIYETTTDHSVGEHIDNAKNKVVLGKVQKTASLENYNLNKSNEINHEEMGGDNESGSLKESKVKVWKKYEPSTTQDAKKYFFDKKKIKPMKSGSFESSRDDNRLEKIDIKWQAPKNRVLDKLVKPDKLINEWTQGKEIIPSQTNVNVKESNFSDFNTLKKKSKEAHELVEIYSKHDNQLNENEGKTQVSKFKPLSFNKESYETKPENLQEDIIKDKVNNDLTLEEEVLIEKKSLEDSKNTIESKSEKPTIGESKYEIDSDSVNERGPPKEKEKTVITHFKQFRPPLQPEKTEKSDNFIVEASMLKVTLLKEDKEEPAKNFVEIQSFESLSNNVENELNNMLTPYIQDLMVKYDQMQRNNKTELKSKEFFLNLIKLKEKSITKDQIKKAEYQADDIEKLKDDLSDADIKIKAGVVGKKDPKENLSHTLRASIEQLYMKHVNFVIPTESNNQSHQLRASIENLYSKKYVNPREEVSETESTSNASHQTLNSEIEKTSSISTEKEPEVASAVENETNKEQDKKLPISKKYDAIAKELNKMFVKEDSKHFSEEPPNTEDLKRKEMPATEKLKTNLDQKDISSLNKNIVEVSKLEEEPVIKKEAKSEASIPDEAEQNNKEEIHSKEGIKESHSEETLSKTRKSKPTIKSYYSYDSSIKNILSKNIPSSEANEDIDKESKYKNLNQNIISSRSASRVRLPIFKPKLFKKRKPSPKSKSITRQDSSADFIKNIRKKYDKRGKNMNKDLLEDESIQSSDKLESSSEDVKKPLRRMPSSFYSYDSTIKPQKKEEGYNVNDDNDNAPNLTSGSTDSNEIQTDNTEEKKSKESASPKGTDNAQQQLAPDRSVDTIKSVQVKESDVLPQAESDLVKITEKQEDSKEQVSLNTDVETSLEFVNEKNIKTSAEYINEFQEPILKSEYLEDKIEVFKKNKTENEEKLEASKKDDSEHDSIIKTSKEEPFSEITEPLSSKDSSRSHDHEANIQSGANIEETTLLKKSYSKDMIVEDVQEKIESKEPEKTTVDLRDNVSVEGLKDVEAEDQSKIIASSEGQKEVADTVRSKTSEDIKTEKPAIINEGFEKLRQKGRDLLQPPKQYVPYEGERKPNVVLEKWEKEPTYLKNLRPGYYKMAADEKRIKNYEENEKRFKNLRTLNKISSANKYSNCDCRGKEKWTADMCCSLEDENENKKVDEDTSLKNDDRSSSTSQNKLGRPSKARSGDWPDTLVRKKEAVIKQPMTPRPPWRN